MNLVTEKYRYESDQSFHSNKENFHSTLDALFRNSTRGTLARAIISADPGSTATFFGAGQGFDTDFPAVRPSGIGAGITGFGEVGEMDAGVSSSAVASLDPAGVNHLPSQSEDLGFSDLLQGFDEPYNGQRWQVCMEEGCP